eukprot:1396779-Rhodomonas_salina.1
MATFQQHHDSLTRLETALDQKVSELSTAINQKEIRAEIKDLTSSIQVLFLFAPYSSGRIWMSMRCCVLFEAASWSALTVLAGTVGASTSGSGGAGERGGEGSDARQARAARKGAGPIEGRRAKSDAPGAGGRAEAERAGAQRAAR